MTADDLLSNLTPERQMRVLRSAYIQAIVREQGINRAQAVSVLDQVAGCSSPSPISGPVDGYPNGAPNE
jgi:hypothetical protein